MAGWQVRGRALSRGTISRDIGADALATQAAELMERHRITSLLVTEAASGQLIGALHVGDLMRAKVI